MNTAMSFTIKPISADDTLPLRQRVLWPDYPVEYSMVEGDASALHSGGFLKGELICVASLYQDGSKIRLRKFATDTAFQGRGYGSEMLTYLLGVAKAAGAEILWFDARESALRFYERHGCHPEGERFFKSEIPYRRVAKFLL